MVLGIGLFIIVIYLCIFGKVVSSVLVVIVTGRCLTYPSSWFSPIEARQTRVFKREALIQLRGGESRSQRLRERERTNERKRYQ